MTAMSDLLHDPHAKALGWTLLHLLWQGAVVGGLLAGTLAALRRGTAHARYLASCAALATLAACPFVTFALLTSSPGGTGPNAAQAHVAAVSHFYSMAARLAAHRSLRATEAWSGGIATATERLLPVLLVFWLIGVALMSVRLWAGWAGVRRLQHRRTRPITGELQERCAALARQMNIARTVELLESALAEVPTTFGWLRAVVLLPASAVSGLSPRALEALIAHELAHIRRCDYLVNLLQTALETLLFYHPATWWISRQIRLEREHCCDDLAVAILGDAKGYAKALAALETWRQIAPSPALAATGGELLPRIRRVLSAPSPQTGPEPTGSAVMFVFAMALISIVTFSLPIAYRRSAAAIHTADLSVRRTVAATIKNLLGIDHVTASRPYHMSFVRHGARSEAARAVKANAIVPATGSAGTIAALRHDAGKVGEHTNRSPGRVRLYTLDSAGIGRSTPPLARHLQEPVDSVPFNGPTVTTASLRQHSLEAPANDVLALVAHTAFIKSDKRMLMAVANGLNHDDPNRVEVESGIIKASSSDAAPDDHDNDRNDADPDERRAAEEAKHDPMIQRSLSDTLNQTDRQVTEAMRIADVQVRRALAVLPVQMAQIRRDVERAQKEIKEAQQQSARAFAEARRSMHK